MSKIKTIFEEKISETPEATFCKETCWESLIPKGDPKSVLVDSFFNRIAVLTDCVDGNTCGKCSNFVNKIGRQKSWRGSYI